MVNKNWIFILPVLVVIADRLSKLAVLNNISAGAKLTIVPGLLYFTNINNTGTVFGLFSGMNLLFVLVNIFVLALVAVYFYKTKEQTIKVLLALVFGAAIGNLIDRIVYGHVVDFIRLSFYPPVFNVADSVLTVCIVWFAVYLLVNENKNKKKIKKK